MSRPLYQLSYRCVYNIDDTLYAIRLKYIKGFQTFVVGQVGLEPTEPKATDLQSVPLPVTEYCPKYGEVYRIRTGDNQLEGLAT